MKRTGVRGETHVFGVSRHPVATVWVIVVVGSAVPYFWDPVMQAHWNRSPRSLTLWLLGVCVLGLIGTLLFRRDGPRGPDAPP